MIPPTPTTRSIDEQLLSLERQRLSLERETFEFHCIEVVSRMAIELGSGGVGTRKKRSPDIEGAIKLLAGSKRALDGVTEEEVSEWVERVGLGIADRMEPPLYWCLAKPKQSLGTTGQKLTWGVLCNPKAKDDDKIRVGLSEYVHEKGVDEEERGQMKWRTIGTWEVLRDKGYGGRILMEALAIMCSQSKEMKTHNVSESDVSRIMAEPEISEPLFRALLDARRRLGSKSQKGSAAVSATPPRGKKTAGR